MSWLSRLLGSDAKYIGVDGVTKSQTEDDSYAIAWRNRYLAARIKFLNEQLKTNNFSGVSDFILPEDILTGSLEYLTAVNEDLAARVEYLEDLLRSH